MSPRGDAAVGELAQALGQEARLGDVRRAGLRRAADRGRRPRPSSRPCAGLSSETSVSRSSAAGPPPRGSPPDCEARLEGHEAVEQRRADEVDAASTSGRERKLPRSGTLAPPPASASAARRRGAEHLEVGVAEAVDRLELVADHEQPGLGAAQRVDQRELDAVRVLELVDHQMGEALPPAPRATARRPRSRSSARSSRSSKSAPGALRLEPLVVPVEGAEQVAAARPGPRSRELGLGRSSARASPRRSLTERRAGPGSGRRGGSTPWLRSRSCAASTSSRRRGLRKAAAKRAASPSPARSDLLERRLERALGEPRRLGLVEDAEARDPSRRPPGAAASSRRQKPWIVVIQARSLSRAARSDLARRARGPRARRRAGRGRPAGGGRAREAPRPPAR